VLVHHLTARLSTNSGILWAEIVEWKDGFTS